MKSVMISIQPKWVEKIANGEKTIEVRKNRPKLETPFKCYIYMTQGKSAVIGEFICDWIYNYYADDFVGAEDFDGTIITEPTEGVFAYWVIDLEKTSLTYNEIKDYGKGKTLYGWHISDLKIYDKPKELSEFRKPCVDKYQYCQGCEHGLISIPPDEEEYALYHCGYHASYDTVCLNRMKRPPQSWCYIEEVEE